MKDNFILMRPTTIKSKSKAGIYEVHELERQTIAQGIVGQGLGRVGLRSRVQWIALLRRGDEPLSD